MQALEIYFQVTVPRMYLFDSPCPNHKSPFLVSVSHQSFSSQPRRRWMIPAHCKTTSTTPLRPSILNTRRASTRWCAHSVRCPSFFCLFSWSFNVDIVVGPLPSRVFKRLRRTFAGARLSHEGINVVVLYIKGPKKKTLFSFEPYSYAGLSDTPLPPKGRVYILGWVKHFAKRNAIQV